MPRQMREVDTLDHGGSGFDHYDPTVPENYTVPVQVWGPGVPSGADLYLMNTESRQDPGDTRPDYLIVPQPIRNTGTGNLALYLFGLPAISGSTVNSAHDLEVFPEGDDLPVVGITSPENETVYTILDTARIEADVSVVSGTVEKVEFFSNWIKIGENETWPYSFEWITPPAGDYVITARAMKDTGIGSYANVNIEVLSAQTGDDDRVPVAPLFVCPNPFSRSTRIEYSLDAPEPVMLSVYDLQGRKVRSRFFGLKDPGRHSAYFSASGLQPGVYFYRMQIGVSVLTGKFMIIR